MIEHEFNGIFLTIEGTRQQDQGLTIDDTYRTIKPFTLDLMSIESYFENDTKALGKTICQIRTKTADVWEAVITYDELKKIKKSYVMN
jgi:hypothetical protein